MKFKILLKYNFQINTIYHILFYISKLCFISLIQSTPFNLAIREGNIEIVKLLLARDDFECISDI